MTEKKKNLFDQKFCKIHNQKYADFLQECPVCVGERMIVEEEIPRKFARKITERTPRKFVRRTK